MPQSEATQTGGERHQVFDGVLVRPVSDDQLAHDALADQAFQPESTVDVPIEGRGRHAQGRGDAVDGEAGEPTVSAGSFDPFDGDLGRTATRTGTLHSNS